MKLAEYSHSATKRGWSQYLLGLARFRAGKYGDAARELSELQSNIWPGKVLAWPVLAMANDKLGVANEARNWLMKAEYLDPKTIVLWWDREEFRLLLREAETQLKTDYEHLKATIKDASGLPTAIAKIGIAQIAYNKTLYAASTRIWSDVFASNPDLMDNLNASYRYNAACSAALAGYGWTKDDPPPDDEARRAPRSQALEWLKDDLAARSKLLEKANPATTANVAKVLAYWKEDPDLASIRDPSELAKLPKAEQSALGNFWSNLDAVIAKAKEKVQTGKAK